MKKIKHYIKTHKIVSGIIGLVVIIGGGYGVAKAMGSGSTAPQYVLGTVTRGTISSTVSGSGQVAAVNQIDIKAKASGDVTAVNVINGQALKAGTLLISLDARDAQFALESARLSYAKLTQPADAVSLVQAENSLKDAQNSQQKSIEDLSKSYDSGVTAVASTFLDLPDIMSGLNSMLNGGTGYLSDLNQIFSGTTLQYRNQTLLAHSKATISYEQLLLEYKNVSRTSSTSTIEHIIDSTYETTKLIAEALKNAKSTADFVRDQQLDKNQASGLTAQSNLTSWINKMNSHLSDLASVRSSIQSAKDNVDSSARNIDERTRSLTKLNAGADPLDVQSQLLSLRQKEYAYQDAFVRAPFDGVVAKINVKPGDSVSSGTSIATFITTQKVANISLNEIDAAKVAVGQKVALTFDAIDNFNLEGVVSDVDLVGTVTQGVVTYNIKISFDSEDPRIKPGMSVSTVITTSAKSDVLVIPTSAIKTRGNMTYVEMLDQSIAAPTTRRAPGMGTGMNGRMASTTTGMASTTFTGGMNRTGTGAATRTFQANQTASTGVTSATAPTQRTITIGISDDLMTEVTSGLTEGEKIVVRTITASTARTTSTAPSILNAARPSGTTGGNTMRFAR